METIFLRRSIRVFFDSQVKANPVPVTTGCRRGIVPHLSWLGPRPCGRCAKRVYRDTRIVSHYSRYYPYLMHWWCWVTLIWVFGCNPATSGVEYYCIHRPIAPNSLMIIVLAAYRMDQRVCTRGSAWPSAYAGCACRWSALCSRGASREFNLRLCGWLVWLPSSGK